MAITSPTKGCLAGSGARARIVAITGYGQASDKRAAMAVGFDQHLTKPVDDEVLEALIDTAGVD